MSKTAEILSIGTEILLGNIVNSDAQVISEGLSELGINVYYHSVVGDNAERIKGAVALAKSRADILITTGGLGPTYDDITKETVAEGFGKKLVLHRPTLERIRTYFASTGRAPTQNNDRQAMLPEGCTIFENDWGTAPGCGFEADGKYVIMLPGPPRECTAMFRNCVMPYLRGLSDAVLVSKNVRIFGIGEGAMESVLHDIIVDMKNPTVAPYAKEGECFLRVTAKAENAAEAEASIGPVIDMIKSHIGDYIYGIDVDSLEEAVLGLLTERGLTLAAAESCSGGMLSERITELAGASKAFIGGVCAYQNSVKTGVLGVPEEIIEKYGAVSEQTAEAMASGVRRLMGADIGVSITGVAGPELSEGKPVGTVFVGIDSDKGTHALSCSLGNGRHRVRTSATNRAFDLIRRSILGLEEKT